MTLVSRRAEEPAVCSIHNKTFTRFGNDRRFSYGCPICVRLIQEQVRALRDSFIALHKKGRKRGPNGTGLKRMG